MAETVRWGVAILCAAMLATAPAAADDLATCYDTKTPQGAVPACTRLITAGAYSPMAHVYRARGHAHRANGNYDQAIADFDEGIRLEPNDSICYGQRGIAYRLKGNTKQALADLQTAVELDPKNQTAVNELAKVRAGQ